MDPENPWQPRVYRYAGREAKLLAPYARKCVAKDQALIWASQLNCRLDVRTMWKGKEPGRARRLAGEPGFGPSGYLHHQKGIFEKTYEKSINGRRSAAVKRTVFWV